MENKEISFEEVSKFLYYDETSPSCLRWKIDRTYTAKVGTIAGTIRRNKETEYCCWKVTILNKTYRAHRIVYCLIHGNIPVNMQVDHIDGNPLNNKYTNLRLVQREVNMRNLKQNINNSTGVTGVRYEIKRNRYIASYYDTDNIQISKFFSCTKLGKQQAFLLACQWRLDRINEMNDILGEQGYSERHIQHSSILIID